MDVAVSRLPELGPHLGRLCALPAPSSRWAVLDDIRLDLATEVLELASAARAFGDDRAAVAGALRRHEWLAQWDRALGRAAERTVQSIDDAFASAAAESRLPQRKLVALRVTDEERDAITARLGAGAAPFVAALDRMDQLAAPAGHGGPAGEAAFGAWWEAVVEAGRKLEAAWESLERAAAAEEARWAPEVGRVRAWRRPAWPLWLVTALVLAAATWIGLVLGGYLTAPAWLRPFAEFWWARVPSV
jgi:hypothetical protein